MYQLTPKGRHSLLQEAPTVLLEAEAEGLSVSWEETQLGLSYLYQPAAPSPLFQFGRDSQGSSSNPANGAGLPELLLAPECRKLRMLPTRELHWAGTQEREPSSQARE